ncbi:CUB domain-containing protein [Ditylenchus destructor]|nr:CUB domain-containing protein [Ditylenchus destructor]
MVDVSQESINPTLRSPKYPEEYPDGVECVYTITVPEGNTVKLVLYDLHMYPGCCDFLYIYNGKEMKRKNLISRANGNGNFTSDAKSLNISYTTTDTNVMTLKFTTDPQHHDRGFYARYDAIPASNSDPASTICPNEEHEGEFGVIVSPKWPNNYHPQALCHYKVTVPEGKKVFLRINFFDTEDIWDHLNIYDGNSTSSTKMASLSGVTKAGTTYKTSGRNAYLTFTSNPTVQKQGYSITYQAVTG